MQIESKYNYHDQLWYMKDNKPTQICIDEFKAECTYNGYADGGWGTERTYPIRFWYRDGNRKTANNEGWIPEYSLFKTKEELLASL